MSADTLQNAVRFFLAYNWPSLILCGMAATTIALGVVCRWLWINRNQVQR